MSGLEVVAPLVGAVGTIGVEEVRTTIASKFAFSKHLDDNYHILIKDTEMLQAIQKDKEIEAHQNSHRDTTNAYKLWTNKVSEATEEVRKLKLKYEIKTLPRWRIQKRSRLSEEMEKKSNWVRQLMNDGCLTNFLVDKPPEPVLKELNVPQISGYPTLQGALDNILDLLKNNKIKIIGVCGTKGVGKTTIMRNLNNNEEMAKLFEIVIFVKVTSNDRKLQEKIAHRLMLDKGTTKEDSDDVARRIHRELDNKRYLLILDEVEDAINLELLGIPSNGSKVVIVTRFPRVYKLNRVQRVINVEKLSLDEAWKMFRDTVHAFNPKIDSPDIQLPAKLVCKRCCCGLPLLIYNIANSFRLKESASSWWAGVETNEEEIISTAFQTLVGKKSYMRGFGPFGAELRSSSPSSSSGKIQQLQAELDAQKRETENARKECDEIRARLVEVESHLEDERLKRIELEARLLDRQNEIQEISCQVQNTIQAALSQYLPPVSVKDKHIDAQFYAHWFKLTLI